MKKITLSLLVAFLPFFAGCSQSSGGAPPSNPSTQQTQNVYFGDSSTSSVPSASLGYSAGELKKVDGGLGMTSMPDRALEKNGRDKTIKEASKPEVKFLAARLQPLSTFSADVDTASYSNMRRFLREGHLPPAHMIRVEEMLNYFNYDLPEPKADEPFSVTTELSQCPWSSSTQLMRVAIKTEELKKGDTPPRNLVFLLDVSGSMTDPDKLPLLKESLRKLVDNLDDADTVSMVVYAGASGIVLPPTTGDRKTTILEAIENLQAGGSTNGSSGIQLAYEMAEKVMDDRSVNRIILATDGDFNVGLSSLDALKALIEEKRKSGIFLSVLGFGHNSNDELMETLADNGNGNYANIDSVNEAERVLVKEAGATLVTVAKDVKFQVAFDPKQVESYRLIGYENRRLAARDFDDDTKDAGEVGAGHSVTALYELKLAPQDPEVDLLEKADILKSGQLATVRLRYKQPDADESQLMEVPVNKASQPLGDASSDQQWAAAVTAFGLRLRGELSAKQVSNSQISDLLQPKMSSKPDAYQAEFYSLVKLAEPMMP